MFVEFSPAEELRPVLDAPRRPAARRRDVAPGRAGRRSGTVDRDGGRQPTPALPSRSPRRGPSRVRLAGGARATLAPLPRRPTPARRGRAARPRWPRRRGGSAGSTTASRPARRPTAATTSSATPRRPGQCAVWLWEHHAIRAGRRSPAAGCGGRAARSKATRSASSTAPCCSARRRAAHGGGELDRGAGDARTEVIALARRLRSADLEAEALQTEGRLLIDQGELAEGLGHLDEAMLFAVEGRLGPYSTGKVYCSLISACEDVGDSDRAAEWTEATRPVGRATTRSRSSPASAGCTAHRPQAARRRSPRPSARRAGCDGAAPQPRPNAAAALRRDRRHPAPARRPRRRRGGVRASAEELCGRPAPVWRCCASPRAASTRRGHRRPAASTAPPTGSPAPGCCPALRAGRDRRRRPRRGGRAAVAELDGHRRGLRHPVAAGGRAHGAGPARSSRVGDRPRVRHAAPRASSAGRSSTCPTRWRRPRTLLGQALREAGDDDAARRVVRTAAEDLFDQLGARLDVRRRPRRTSSTAGAAGRPHRA